MGKRFFLTLCLIFLVALNIYPQEKTLFLLAGQSNAQGLGGKGSKVYCLENTCFEYNVLFDSIIPLVDPVGQNWKTLNRSGGSICPAFAREYNSLSGGKVYMVTAAKSGSSCHTKSRLGHYNTWAKSGDVFADAVEKTHRAEKMAQVKLSGIIWMQGERDANAIIDGKLTPEEYASGLMDVIKRFRAEFGKNLPFYIVMTGYQLDKEPKGCQAVRKMQEKVAKKMKKVYIAYSATDTFAEKKWYIDNVHYNQDALNDIGKTVARFSYKFH